MISTLYCKILKQHLNVHIIYHPPAMLHSNACIHVVVGSIQFSGKSAVGNEHPEVKESSSSNEWGVVVYLPQVWEHMGYHYGCQ
jgi:hypothetical protein